MSAYDGFAPIYDAWASDMTEDVEFYVELVAAADGEWEAVLDVSGLETEALYGWFDRRPFDETAHEFVWIARKPA